MEGTDSQNRKCYYCGEDVQDYARRCDYCGSLLKVEFQQLQQLDDINHKRNKLSNGMKVFLTVISSLIPGIGQIIGVIISIILINTDNDQDRRSFGIALLVASMIVFVATGIIFFLALVAFFSLQQM